MNDRFQFQEKSRILQFSIDILFITNLIICFDNLDNDVKHNF